MFTHLSSIVHWTCAWSNVCIYGGTKRLLKRVSGFDTSSQWLSIILQTESQHVVQVQWILIWCEIPTWPQVTAAAATAAASQKVTLTVHYQDKKLCYLTDIKKLSAATRFISSFRENINRDLLHLTNKTE